MAEFLSISEGETIAQLSTEYARRGYTSQYTDQTLTWERDIHSLRRALTQCAQDYRAANDWGILLEFSIPRKEVRIDVVLLIRDQIVIVEAKTGSAFTQARKQLEEYALLLHYFHKASADRKIVPVIVSPEAGDSNIDPLKQREMFPQLATYWVDKVVTTSWDNLPSILATVSGRNGSEQISIEAWDEARIIRSRASSKQPLR